MASRKGQQSCSKYENRTHQSAGGFVPSSKSQEKPLDHLLSIFKGKIDSSVVEIVFYESSCDCKLPPFSRSS